MIEKREIRHFHLFCGLGGGAKGFNSAQPRVGTTLLLSWSGETFVLSATPIWVRPVAMALTVAQRRES